ncbi:MAG: hypothetical protein II842_14045 [Butyrivibrio sp.]|nr:hypothetical protein [Butyrivibrio sp.]
MENLLGGSKKKFVKYEEGAAMFSMGLHILLTVDDGLLTYHACPVDDRMATQLN